jgi:hypothetical protein
MQVCLPLVKLYLNAKALFFPCEGPRQQFGLPAHAPEFLRRGQLDAKVDQLPIIRYNFDDNHRKSIQAG